MADYYIKQGDNWPTMYATLKDANGNTVNLSGATVTLYVKLHGAIIFSGTCVVEDIAGYVSYTWANTDTVTNGDAKMEFKVYWSASGKTSRFPDDKSLDLQITKNLTS